MALSVPTPETADVAWFEQMLSSRRPGVRVASVTARPVGTGQLGDTVRFTLDYTAGGEGLPRTLIGKFASTNADSRALARHWSLYRREIGFYRELAAHARISLPLVWAAEIDDDDRFVLVMSDLAPATPGDQIRGMNCGEARLAVRDAARLHAAFWDRGDDSAFAWLDTGALAQPFYGPEVIRGVWPSFAERYADQLEPDHRRVCERLVARYEAYISPLARPRCVVHNDYRPDNMLFDPTGAQPPLTVVDWQSAALGYNAVDVAYLIGGAFAPAARREFEPALLDAYHEELRAQGVAGYDRAMLDEDFRHFSFAGINVAVGAAMLVKRTERGDRIFLTMLDRHVRHALDVGALAILD